MGLRRAIVVTALIGTFLGACAEQADVSPLGGSAGRSRAGSCPGGELTATEVLDCVSPSVALVETPAAGGSGILVDGGYVVTNAHVVDPYGVADVVFSDGARRVDVPVVGIDALADIAVLGPIDVDREPLAIGSGLDLERGRDVYLVGYPGEFDADPEPTISRGVLSRVRDTQDFGHQYLQTDASIGGGQSGGALVDDRGAVLGISGLAFAEQFALALDGTDVLAAIDRILAGEGDEYAVLPSGEGGLVHELVLRDELDQQVLLAPARSEEVTLRLEISDPADVAIDVADLFGEPLLVNTVALERYAAIEDVTADSFGIAPDEPVAPGVYEVELPAEVETLVAVSIASPGPRTVTIRSSGPLLPMGPRERQPIGVGDTVDGLVGFLDSADVFVVQLSEGDRVDLTARSPQGDMALYVRAPGAPLGDLERFDDGGGGLYDYDAEGTVTASTTGEHVIVVASLDGVVTGYRFRIAEG